MVGVLLLWVCCGFDHWRRKTTPNFKAANLSFLWQTPYWMHPELSNLESEWLQKLEVLFSMGSRWDKNKTWFRLNSNSISMYCRWRTKPFFLRVFHDTSNVVLKGLWTGRRVESLRWRLSRTPFRCLLAGQCAVWLPSSALRSNHNRKHLDGL